MEEILDESFFTDEDDNVLKAEIEVQKTGLENSFNERQVGSVAISIEPINGNAGLDVALARFESQQDLQAIPVEKDDRVIGVIERTVVEEETSSTLKRLVSKSCSDYVKECSFYVNCNDFMEKIAAKANAIALKENIHFFPVFLNNRSFFGIVSIEDINTKIQSLREEDLQKAESIQQNMLKVTSDVKNFPFHVCVWNKMANSVGGDYYATQDLGDNKFIISCFDVSGKNVSAALLTVTIASFFTMLGKINKNNLNASSILVLLDDYLKQVVPIGNFITGIICFIDKKANKIELFNCGHTNAYLILGNDEGRVKVATLQPKLPPFGMGAVSEALKKPGDVVYRMPVKMGLQIDIYSDGLTDMQNEDGERYDENNTKEFFKQLYTTDVYSCSKYIEKTVTDWVGRTMLPDDITVLNMRF